MSQNTLLELSTNYGTGEPLFDSLIVFSIAITIGLIISALALRRAGIALKRAEELSKMPWGGKIERLDKTLNETISALKREIEILKNQASKTQVVDAASKEEKPTAPALEVTEEKVIPVFEEPTQFLVEETPKGEVEVETVAAPLATRLKSSRLGFFQRLKGIFGIKPTLDPAMIDELEATLVSSDLGAPFVATLVEKLKAKVAAGGALTQSETITFLKSEISSILDKDVPATLSIDSSRVADGPRVVLVVGVNGVGKTTTVAKLAHQLTQKGSRVLLVAADTFRAAAVAQLETWAQRIGVPVVKGADNAKPASVVFDAMERATREEFDVVLIDTAGRLQTKANLMLELEGIKNSIHRHQASAPHECILVLDGSTGQNALSQAQEFNDAVKLTGIIVTKLDGTPKGGVVVAIKDKFNIPIRYLGVGESMHDLREFKATEFVDALFDRSESDTDEGAEGKEVNSAHGMERRRRRAA